ncbi:hypothetical protein PB2503_07799 [Parvularcula bermudensis HTCC2503]|uniref:SAM-dependent methyltransferase n=1 Tax=Parvularcula bermudensis (strain ATCC BAA-594 / HTCC2503 / KCTC 12087) TaxID=314260 RepID=E0TGJ6_PARBH|nr:DUF938 domain-containing protein [Parvularcula bermudensis]ADM09615.1 hypothetical protein PB2503_07799 [Parvularcula bermudensis HTCC2503]
MSDDHQRGPDGKEIALEARSQRAGKLVSPSVARNKEPIAAAFADTMPQAGHILEIGSGTGEHGMTLTARFPDLIWQPSDPDDNHRHSIDAYAADTPRLLSSLPLDVTDDGWWQAAPLSAYDGVVSINMIHIAPFAAAEGVFRGAAALLSPGCKLFLYGPFSRRGEMADSNRRFDADLKRRDPAWGVRDLDDQVQPLGARFALHLSTVTEMPANNLSVVFEKG